MSWGSGAQSVLVCRSLRSREGLLRFEVADAWSRATSYVNERSNGLEQQNSYPRYRRETTPHTAAPVNCARPDLALAAERSMFKTVIVREQMLIPMVGPD